MRLEDEAKSLRQREEAKNIETAPGKDRKAKMTSILLSGTVKKHPLKLYLALEIRHSNIRLGQGKVCFIFRQFLKQKEIRYVIIVLLETFC